MLQLRTRHFCRASTRWTVQNRWWSPCHFLEIYFWTSNLCGRYRGRASIPFPKAHKDVIYLFINNRKPQTNLRDLLGYNDSSVHAKLVLAQVQVFVKCQPLAHARHQRQRRQIHARAHKEDEILMACLAECCYLVFKRLEHLLIADLIHVQESNGNVAVPIAPVDSAETSLANQIAQLQLVKRNVPLAQWQLSGYQW